MTIIGDGSIDFYGPQLSIYHEDVYCQLVSYFRGQLITSPVKLHLKQLCEDLNVDPGGSGYAQVKRRLTDLDKSKIRISCPSLLANLVYVFFEMKKSTGNDPKLQSYITHQYKDKMQDIAEALRRGDPYYLTMGFIQNLGMNGRRRQATISLDPLTILLFDGVNTTLINRMVRDSVKTPKAKKILGLIESYSSNLPLMLGKQWASFLGSSISNWDTGNRAFKADLTAVLEELESREYIHNSWDYFENEAGDWGTVGLRPTSKLKEQRREALAELLN